MVSVKRFIYDEPALFTATVEFVSLLEKTPDPVVSVAACEKEADVRVAWTLLGTALFQEIGYGDFERLMEALQKRFPREKLWTLPVPKVAEIEETVEAALKSRRWALFDNVAGIFWSVGLFVRRHLTSQANLQLWLQKSTPQELWRDLGEIYFMGRGNPRPKACAAIYRLTAPFPVGLGIACAPSAQKPSLPLTMGARRYLSILGPGKDGFAELESVQKQKLLTELCLAVSSALKKTPYLVAHSLQFFLETKNDEFICRKVMNQCKDCPLRMFCSYAR